MNPMSVAEWVAEAVREKLAADEQLQWLEARAAGASRADFERILAQVPDVPPIPGDELP